jgi:PEP-CTERM motif
MFSQNARPVLRAALAALLVALGTNATQAASVPVSFTNMGVVGGSTAFRASLTGLGLTQVGSITINDSGSGLGGSGGIFSGFDVDALFLDLDGSLLTSGDRVFGSSFLFTAGATRATLDPAWLPTAAHPGPTFGSVNSTTIDLAVATLNALDGLAFADVDMADGFLTLGDGGSLTANFAPVVPVGAALYLFVGEVGTGAGEAIRASVFVSDSAVPEPGALSLVGLGLVAAGLARRRRA